MRRFTPYILLAPALLFTVFILVYPVLQNLINSFRDVSLVRQGGGWTGLLNYEHVFTDGVFWLAFRNTVLYAVTGTLLALCIGLGLALVLDMNTGKMSTAAACLYSVPWVVSPVVAGFAWKWLLNDHFGVLNYWLSLAGIARIGTSWLGDPRAALLCVMVARAWQFYPFAMVMFLAGLQSIPAEQYEAASVDGASVVRKFFHITIPNLRPVSSVLLLLGVIWSFNDFNMVFVMTRGGPINASMVLPVLVREFSFVHFDMGKGSALSIVIFTLLVTLSFLYLRVLARREQK
ncbi:MAG TPA: sugar ABC transporter permease [Bacteroidota bacterium]|nr:sugar ABC transporter permease [Bacteroidota bacterium]